MPGGRRTFGCRASCGMSERVEPTDVTVHVLREIRDEIREVKDLLSDRLEIRDRVERCEREIDWLKSRVGGPG
jgi:phosphoglycerate-specific signal transduction histidine kinase